MKLTVKTVKVPALLLAIVMAFACFANVGSRNASAAAAYGEELVTNGDFEDFRSEFGADIEETESRFPAAVPLGAYEDRKYDCYNSSSLNGGQAQFVQDGEKRMSGCITTARRRRLSIPWIFGCSRAGSAQGSTP